MKYFLLVLSIIMVLFVVVQYNDPDPLKWMLIYGYCAIILALAAFGISNKWLLFPAYLIFGAGFIWLFPSVIEFTFKERGDNFMQQMNNDKLYIEETRECLGLLVSIIFISFIWIPIKRSKK